MRSVVRVGDHGVRRHHDAALAGKLRAVRDERTVLSIQGLYLLLLIGGENSNLLVRHVGPLHELLPPLHNRHPASTTVNATRRERSSGTSHLRRGAQNQTGLLDCTSGGDAHKRLASAAGQDNNSRTGTSAKLLITDYDNLR